MNDNKSNIDKAVVVGTLTKNKARHWLSKKYVKTAVIIILVTGIGTLIWYISIRDTAKSPPVKTRSYSFDDKQAYRFLARHVLVGEGNGNSLEIGIPLTEFLYTDGPVDKIDPRFQTYKKPTDKIQDKGNKVALGQRVFSSDGTVYHQSLIAARIVSPDEKPKFNKHNYFKEVLDNFVFMSNTGNSKLLNLDIRDNVRFANKQISSNASKSKIYASLPNGLKTNGPISQAVGELIEISGKKSDYYVLIVSIKSTWENSTKTWLAVQDSIVIDQ